MFLVSKLINKYAVQRKRVIQKKVCVQQEAAYREFVYNGSPLGCGVWGFASELCCALSVKNKGFSVFFWFRLDFSSDHRGFRNKQTHLSSSLFNTLRQKRNPTRIFFKRSGEKHFYILL